jgi:hypothetical protein
MRFLGLLNSEPSTAASPASRLSVMEKVGRLMEEATKAGVLTATELEPDLTCARVKLSAGEFTITGQSPAQPKSHGASYAMFDVDSIVEAILWTKCFLQVLGEGECEIHPLCAA